MTIKIIYTTLALGAIISGNYLQASGARGDFIEALQSGAVEPCVESVFDESNQQVHAGITVDFDVPQINTSGLEDRLSALSLFEPNITARSHVVSESVGDIMQNLGIGFTPPATIGLGTFQLDTAALSFGNLSLAGSPPPRLSLGALKLITPPQREINFTASGFGMLLVEPIALQYLVPLGCSFGDVIRLHGLLNVPFYKRTLRALLEARTPSGHPLVVSARTDVFDDSDSE